jgi:hypothetical protein
LTISEKKRNAPQKIIATVHEVPVDECVSFPLGLKTIVSMLLIQVCDLRPSAPSEMLDNTLTRQFIVN